MPDVRDFFKRWPNFYYFIAVVFGPMLMTGLSARGFLKKYPARGSVLNLGSGPRILGGGVTNVDIFQYPGVSLVADITRVPLGDGSAARIISDTVLEHVTDPIAAVAEMRRLLQHGGLAYVTAPFLYPFHSSPSDYQRWTRAGLLYLFRDFDIVEIGVRAGPISALTAYLCHFAGTVFSFGSEWLYSLVANLAMFVFFPLKLIDIIFNFWPQSHMVAAIHYCVVRKK
ncbi:hypothetical protein A3C86_01535 [Candidatus Kaiserbacteria bacterium RIFCSPHIGHO2_02_FULL_49_16]|uniref:Methyltransferase type 11 domain-containing protein n=1 Tax=Candidatus Kaiserbacteria bacterium RIFCSPHIGHO2_02_FULL_49_16 TaxID=1798490 RepID=A0A1F6DD31_9BACT|nr:MAG: hypothetical protein A3C86_01535 [Candidatus Kaiserbacteria bacterium RIFCSPHIGHO2_02_FULL_49_16]